MKKRVFTCLLACSLLAGCGLARTEPVEDTPSVQPPSVEDAVIAYVPLDDRPDNEERVIYLAESLGYVLEMPERDLYHTALDGQPLNQNGTQSGDRAALYEWVMEMENSGCDRYILSMDQLLSGGLVNSRHMERHVGLVLSDGTVLTEYEAMESLLTLLASDGENRVWLLDSVMRLAPTVGYLGFGLEEYNALRAYGIEGRPVLAESELTLENIQADYRLGTDGAELSPSDFALEEAEVAEYLSARERKLALSVQMFSFLHDAQLGNKNFRVLIGIDDSSVEDSIQKNEIACLRSLLREQDTLLSGVDDLAFKAVARLYLDEVGWDEVPVALRYFGGTAGDPACAYDYKPLTEIMNEHFDFFGLRTEGQSDEEPCFMILVLTQPAVEKRKAEYYEELIQMLQEYQESTPIILIDAGNAQYGTAFHEALTKEVELGRLLSYAGALDMAIVTGTALSHGVARYAYLCRNGGETTEAAERAFARTLADSIIKDFCYRHIVRAEVSAYAQESLGGNGNNFWQPEIDREALLALLERRMAEAAAPVIKNLERSNYIFALSPYEERGWGGIELTNYRFPWDRAFEIGMDIRLGGFTEPHKNVLGIYYQ